MIGLTLDLLLGGLLLVALFVGFRLERRLKVLRQTQTGFAGAVAELNEAIARAEAGLADLKGAALDAKTTLTDRIQDAKALAVRLEKETAAANKAAERLERAAELRPRFMDMQALRPPPAAGEVDRRAGGGAPTHSAPSRSRLDAADGFTPPPALRAASSVETGEDRERPRASFTPPLVQRAPVAETPTALQDDDPLTLRFAALALKHRAMADEDLFEPVARAIGGMR